MPASRLWKLGSSLFFSLIVIASTGCLWGADVIADTPKTRSTDGPSTDGPSTDWPSTDWPWWRGPDRNGIAAPNQQPPLTWSESENVKWKAAVLGKGHGSPIVVDDQVLLLTADMENSQLLLLCFDRETGQAKWQSVIHRGKLNTKGSEKSSLASSTPACDGERIYVNFLFDGAVQTSAIDRQGKILWQTKVCDFMVHQGFASSPAIFASQILVSADNQGGGLLAALEPKTGRLIWQESRPKLPNYTSPIIMHVAGRDQLVLTGCDLVSSFDPRSGKKLWEFAGATTECVTSVVSNGDLIFTSGGYPKNHISALRADGTGQLVWENTSRVYVPSMLVHGDHLYAVLDAGVAACYECSTGKERWKGRIAGTFSSSPVLVGDRFYVTNEAGHTYIYDASPSAFHLVGENQLGNECFATPVFCGNRIYTRVAHLVDGKRQEILYCLGR